MAGPARKREAVDISSHRKRMKNIEDQGSLTTPDAMGRSVPVKTPASFSIANEINGFAHIFHGTALKQRFNFCRRAKNLFCVLSLSVLAFFGSSRTAFAELHDGTGTMTVSPSNAVPGSTGNSFTFSFRDGTLGTFPANSVVTFTVPSGWTAPQTTSASSPGYVRSTMAGDTVNSIAVSGSGPWTVTVNFNGINPASGFDVTYAGGGTQVTAPASLGIYTFTTRSQGGNGGTLTTIATSPTITNNDDLLVTLPGEEFTSGVGNTGVVSNQTAGVAFNLTLYAVGVGGNVRDTTYSGPKTITFSGPATAANGTAPLYTANVTFNNGVATGIATTLTAAETTTITAAAADGTADGVASSSLTVVAGVMDHYGLSAASPQNATEAFPLTVTTQDAFNNPVTTNSPTPVTLGSSTGHASFDSNPITLVNGVGTVSTTVSTAETVDLTASDPNGKKGALLGLVINPAPANGDYRSAASGNWNSTATWQTFNGFIWVAAGSSPDSEKVTIQNDHTVNVTRRVTVNQVIVQFGGAITNGQNLKLGGGGTALDIFGTVQADGLQTAEDGTILTNTIWPLAASTTSIVENGGSLAVDGGDLEVDGTLLVTGGTVTTAAGDNLDGSGTLTISNGTVTVGAPGQGNDFSVNTVNMSGGLLILGRGFTSNTENLTGGTVQFNATQTGFQIPQTTYANVILNGGGSGVMNLNLGNGDTVITGNLSITGTTVVSVRAPLTAHSLTLGGTGVGAGTWGGTLSGADNINTTYFAPAAQGDFITVTSGEELLVTLPGEEFTSGVGNTGVVSNRTAGVAFNLTLYAVGVGGTVLDTSYSGFKTISFSGPANSPNGTAPIYTANVIFNNGVASGIATTLTAAETTTITAAATDGTINGVASSSLTVVAGVMDHYGLGAASPQNATEAFPLTVTAQDAFNNPVTTNSATLVTLSSSTGHASFDSNPITLVNGVGTVSTTDSTAETVNLTAIDPDGKTGSFALLINPAPANGDYRSATSGEWNNTATWERFDGSTSTWEPTLITPTSQKVIIQNGHTVDVTRRVTVNQVLVQTGGTITNAQNLKLDGTGTALDIFGTVNAEGLQTTEAGTTDTTATNWPLASSTTTIVENGGSLSVDGGNLGVDGTLLVAGGTVTIAEDDNLSGSGTLTISNGTVTVGAPGQNNDFNVRTLNMTGGLLILGRGFSPNTANLTGGTIQFTATQTGFQIAQLTYANVILSGGGSGVMNLNLGNGDTVINGNLSITGTTVVSVRAPLTAHSLTLGGTGVGAGTWGGTLSGADNINTTYFAPAAQGDFITVTSGAAAELIVTLPNQTFTSGTGNSGSVTNQVAGISFNITLTAVDANSNIDTTYSGTKTIIFSGPANSPNGTAPIYTANVIFNNGVATGIATILTAAETTTITPSISGLTGVASSSLTVSFTTANAYRIADAASGTPTAGVGDQLTINLADQYGNTVTSFAGDKTLTFSGLSAAADGTFPTVTDKTGTAVNEGTSEAITFTAGVSSAGGSLVAYKAETNTLNVTDSGNLSSTSTGGGGASLTIANVAPVVADMAVTRTAGSPVAVALSDLATHWSDANHDVITLASVSVNSTNSVNVASNANFIVYPSSAPNVSDQITYIITDGTSTTTGHINIAVTPFQTGQPATISTGGNSVTVKFFGIANFTYITQRSTDMATWMNISTNTVDSGGHPFTVTDDFSDLGSVPNSAYYRLMWQP